MSIAPRTSLPSLAVLACGLLANTALAQDYDFNWATIDHPGNRAYDGPDPVNSGRVIGRGSVAYSYRISKYETTTAQWMEFLNTFADDPQPHPFWDTAIGPISWGAQRMGNGHYEMRDIPNAEMVPVSNITWRMGALYCNWLNNGKSVNPNSLTFGAYDTSTWGSGTHNDFTDAHTHEPSAKFWIPTLDEQLKAFQYDPNRYGAGQHGWWLARNRSDEPGTPGWPGEGDTSANVMDWDIWDVPLGAYADSISPWGLWDTSGATVEWNEEIWYGDLANRYARDRGVMGSHAGEYPVPYRDYAWDLGSRGLQDSYAGLRVAATVPAPSASMLLLATVIRVCHRVPRQRMMQAPRSRHARNARFM